MAVIVLIGFMGSGKTSVGQIVAARLELPFVDSDAVIEDRAGRPIRELFVVEGEPAFREREHSTVAELVAGPDAVVALGGGAVLDPRTRSALAGSHVVYLRVSYAEARSRIGSDEQRPLLQRPDIEDVYRSRLAIYEEVATVMADTDGRDAAAVAEGLLGQLTAGRERRT